jgi:hypothetical protein
VVVGRRWWTILNNRLPHPFQVLQYFVIPESYHRESLRFEPLRSRVIRLLLFRMLPAIQFDDQFPVETDKVDNVISDGLLASEFEALRLSSAQMLPQQSLGVSRVFAQTLG